MLKREVWNKDLYLRVVYDRKNGMKSFSEDTQNDKGREPGPKPWGTPTLNEKQEKLWTETSRANEEGGEVTKIRDTF